MKAATKAPKTGARRRRRRAAKTPAPKRRFPAETLSKEEQAALFAACSRRAPSGLRNRALFTLGLHAGLRLAEALELREKDLDATTRAVRVLNGKGGVARTAYLDPEQLGAFDTIDAWIRRRRKLGISSSAPLFCTITTGKRRASPLLGASARPVKLKAGAPLSASYVRALMPRLGKKAGIRKRVYFHMLRHTFAAELAMRRVSVHAIQKLLGHRSLHTTSIYLDHLAPADVLAAMSSRVLEAPSAPRPSPATSPASGIVEVWIQRAKGGGFTASVPQLAGVETWCTGGTWHRSVRTAIAAALRHYDESGAPAPWRSLPKERPAGVIVKPLRLAGRDAEAPR